MPDRSDFWEFLTRKREMLTRQRDRAMGKTVSWKDSNEFKGNSLSRRVSWYPVVDVLIIPPRDIEVESGQDRNHRVAQPLPSKVESGQDRDIEVTPSEVSWHPIVDVFIIPGGGQDRDIEATPPEGHNPPDRDIEVELSDENADTCAQPIPVKHTTTRRKSVTFSKMIEVFIIPSYVIGNGSEARLANPKPSTQNPQTYRKY